jgi:type I restriction enzyme M protein
VIAAWWTDTLPDFKTLMENGFPGVIDGWVDAIADAVADDEAAGPAFDPFGHKLVRRTMADYLEHIAAAKADIARLKGEKEVFEQSNAPDDLDEEELAGWNYAKDLERQSRELKAEHREAFKELARLEKITAKVGPDRRGVRTPKAACPAVTPFQQLKTKLQPVLDQLTALAEMLVPYQQIKTQLAEARARYRLLTDEFVDELKGRCSVMSDGEKRALVLELFEQDVQAVLDAAMAEKRQTLVRFIEYLWDKYRVTLTALRKERGTAEELFQDFTRVLGYQ